MLGNFELPDEFIEKVASRVIEAIKPLLLNTLKGEDPIFDLEGLCKYLGVGKPWVYNKVHLNEIPYFKAGQFIKFRKSQIDKWTEANARKAIPKVQNIKRSA